jgi:TonB family protein
MGYILVKQASITLPPNIKLTVDIITAVPPKALENKPIAPRPPAPPIKNFLALVMPPIPKLTRAAPLEIKLPEAIRSKPLELNAQKLDDQGKLKRTEALKPLDMGQKMASLAKIDMGLATREAKAPLADVPKLEEVGMRQASKKVIEMAALQEEQRSLAMVQLAAIPTGGSRGRAPSEAPLLPSEASPRERSSGFSRVSDMLPAAPQQPLGLEARPTAPIRKPPTISAPSLAPRQRGPSLEIAKPKAVEIIGPIKDRQVVASSIPEFPDWAKSQITGEADVSIKFFVDFSGNVLDNMSVDKPSGLPRLDRLVMQHLKLWRFSAVDPSAGNQWGVITFRFVLE